MSKKKEIMLYFWLLLFSAIILDILDTTLLEYSVKEKIKNKSDYLIILISTLLLFPISNYIFYLLLFYKKPIVIIGLWVVINLMILTIFSSVVKGKKYNKYEKIGIILGFISCILLYI